MKPCPKCGASLGEGAKACASCGWKAGISTVLLVVLIVFGVIALACGGCAVFVGLKAKKAFDIFQSAATPTMLLGYRIAVVEYAEEHGELPATIQEAVQKTGEKVDLPPGMEAEAGQGAIDSWLKPVRYTRNEDGTFEIRSGGPDKQFDTADDLVEAGKAGEDVKALRDQMQRLQKEMERKFEEEFGGK